MKAFYALVLVLVLCELTLQTRTVLNSGKSSTNTPRWRERASVAVQFMRSQPCWRFLNPTNCQGVQGIQESKMNLYIAQKALSTDRLMATLPDKRHHSLVPKPQAHDGVIAIDPYPRASFGHLVFVFFVEEHSSADNCTRDGYGRLTASGDCIRAANKTYCQNNIDERKRKRCWVNFLPLVYSQSDSTKKTQRLECKEGMLGFGKCRQIPTRQLTVCGANSQRCSITVPQVPKSCLWKKCDYAVMLSGGWNSQTALPHHAKNLQLFWRLLRHHKFSKNHITTFYGSDGGIELDGDPATKDAAPAVSESDVRRHINNLCDALMCVDTLVIYLTGPAKSNGAMLLWDANGDGLTENAEKYNVKEIFEDLEGCNANKVIIVADYSYSGHLAHRLTKLRNGNKKQFANITVLASSQSNEYAWGSEFTKAILKHGLQNNTKCMNDVLQEVKHDFQQRHIRSTPVLSEGSLGSGNSTICGKQCGVPWSQAWKGETNGCTFIPISELGRRRQRNSRPKPKKRPS